MHFSRLIMQMLFPKGIKNPVRRPQTLIAGPHIPLAAFQTYKAGPQTPSDKWMKIFPNLPQFFLHKSHCFTVL